jgi:hypothetical protein
MHRPFKIDDGSSAGSRLMVFPSPFFCGSKQRQSYTGWRARFCPPAHHGLALRELTIFG